MSSTSEVCKAFGADMVFYPYIYDTNYYMILQCSETCMFDVSLDCDQFCEKKEDLHFEFPLLQDNESFVIFETRVARNLNVSW